MQLIHCQKGVLAHSTTVNVRNALMQDVQTPFHSLDAAYPATANVEHLTATNITTFKGASQLTINVTNSILVNVGGVAGITLDHCVVNPADPDTVFEAVGAGHYYLPMGSSLCNAGTPNISHALKQDFRQMTTVAPGLLQGTVSTPLTLVPEVWRDVDIPDLGSMPFRNC